MEEARTTPRLSGERGVSTIQGVIVVFLIMLVFFAPDLLIGDSVQRFLDFAGNGGQVPFFGG